MKDRVSLRSTHPAPWSRLRQQLISLRCGPLQSRFARQLPQRGSLYADLNFVLLFHTGTAHNRSVGAGFPRPPAAVSVSDRVQHGPSGTPAPTALFRVACRGDPCDRPFLPAAAYVPHVPGNPAPTWRTPKQVRRGDSRIARFSRLPTMSNKRAVEDAGPYNQAGSSAVRM